MTEHHTYFSKVFIYKILIYFIFCHKENKKHIKKIFLKLNTPYRCDICLNQKKKKCRKSSTKLKYERGYEERKLLIISL